MRIYKKIPVLAPGNDAVCVFVTHFVVGFSLVIQIQMQIDLP